MKQLAREIADFLAKPSTQDFLNAARQFTLLLENEKLSPAVFYEESHKTLSLLYATGTKLEKINRRYLDSDTELKEKDKSKLLAQNVHLIAELGIYSYYWEVFDPSYTYNVSEASGKIRSPAPSQGWLIDDFSDIYEDLKVALFKIDTVSTNASIENALWELKFGFYHHWGNHCINALRAFHYLSYTGKI